MHFSLKIWHLVAPIFRIFSLGIISNSKFMARLFDWMGGMAGLAHLDPPLRIVNTARAGLCTLRYYQCCRVSREIWGTLWDTGIGVYSPAITPIKLIFPPKRLPTVFYPFSLFFRQSDVVAWSQAQLDMIYMIFVPIYHVSRPKFVPIRPLSFTFVTLGLFWSTWGRELGSKN